MDTYLILVLIIIIIGSFLLIRQKTDDDNRYYDLKTELNQKMNKLNSIIEEKQTVQVSADGNLTKKNRNIISMPPLIDPINNRDNAIINDALYPPLSRIDRSTIVLALANPAITGHPTRGSPDTYRPVALAKSKSNEDTYYIMGREKYSGSSQGEFYMIPTDKQNGLKIQLLDDRGNQLIRDIYALPTELKIQTGIFKDKEFVIEELKKTDFIGPYV